MPSWFDKDNIFTPGRCRAILIGICVAVPFVIFGAIMALESSSNRVEDWLPRHFEETQRLKWFKDRFGSGEILVVSWDGCTLGDPRIAELSDALQGAVHSESGEPLFRAILNGPDMLERLTQNEDISPRAAMARCKGWLIGPDEESTCLLILVSETGGGDRHMVVETVYEHARETLGFEPNDLYVGGSTVDSVEIDKTAESGVLGLNAMAWGLCILLIYVCFRSWRVAVLVFQVAILAELWSMANLYYCGVHMDSVSLLMASVVYVLSISAAVHLVNYYREALVHGGEQGAIERAVREALAPCFLATFTTAIGLGSLGASQIVPISKFGMFSALAMLIAFGIVFLLLPAVLKKHPVTHEVFVRGGRYELHRARWAPLQAGIRRLRYPLLLASAGLIVFSFLGLMRIQTTVRLHDMFYHDAKIIRDYSVLEERIGPLVPLEVVVRIPRKEGTYTLDRLDVVNDVRRALEHVDGVGAAISAANFLPYVPDRTTGGTTSLIRRSAIKLGLEQNRDELLETKYLLDDGGDELWRISVRVGAEEEIDYETLLDDLAERVTPVLDAAEARGFDDISAVYSGGIPLVHKAQRQLLDDLIYSFLTAFALVALTMICVFWWGMMVREGTVSFSLLIRGILAGSLSMVPNVFPPLVVFGAMGWMGLSIEMGTMMTASVALGIAVDDTLHFVTWFQRGIADGMSRSEAVMYAYQRCGTAMVQTSLVCGLGLFVFALSPFVPISTFSYLMFVLLAASLLGDLIVLPAILLSPLGWIFESKPGTPTGADDGDQA